MDRLEEEYADLVDFRRLDADSNEGKQAFRAYQLLGHPSYVLLSPNGELLWKGQGEQSFEELDAQIESILN